MPLWLFASRPLYIGEIDFHQGVLMPYGFRALLTPKDPKDPAHSIGHIGEIDRG